MTVTPMSIFAGRLGFALVAAGCGLGAQGAHSQTAPLTYWVPGWPAGFGGDPGAAQSLDSYGNFPGFDAGGTRESGFFSRSYGFSNNWSAFNGMGLGMQGIGMQGIGQYGSLGSFTTEGTQFGYKFKSGVSFYGGFDTLKYDRGGSSAFAAFDSKSSALPVTRTQAGIEFQPAPNVSLSLGFSYTQQDSGRVDSDINSQALPGETPAAFTSGRR
jgi:hypothetical protein